MEKALVLRVCNKNGRSRDGFQWPTGVGESVSAPDWRKNKECGNGLHGWLFGQGDHSSTGYWEQPEAKWYVVEVNMPDVIMLGGKCKFPSAVVKFIGDRKSASDFLFENEVRSRNVEVIGAFRADLTDNAQVKVGALGSASAGDSGTASAGVRGTASAGDSGTASAGDRGTASAGYGGTASAGYGGIASTGNSGTASADDSGTASAGDRGTASAGVRGTASAGYGGTASAGYGGTASAGDSGTASAGDSGTASAGVRGTASAGVRGTASAGDSGTASAGYGGTASAGYGGTASAGYRGTASAGYGGALVIEFWDGNNYRKRVAEVGVNGIEPNVAYKLDGKGNFVRA